MPEQNYTYLAGYVEEFLFLTNFELGLSRLQRACHQWHYMHTEKSGFSSNIRLLIGERTASHARTHARTQRDVIVVLT